MKERGIIFNSEMVRAILDGRKTQTRRIINPQPELTQKSGFKWKGSLFGAGSDNRETNRNFAHKKCPCGNVGDRLWVRETWQGPLVGYAEADKLFKDPEPYFKVENCVYKADGIAAPEYTDCDDNLRQGWRPSSNMPRWASRITLEITDVRVERLQSISEEDAKAEGFDNSQSDAASSIGWFEKPVRAFRRDWENINGTDGWDSNPWVWVIEFKRV
ncbi:hypothetical protein [Providencia rettgeri]|uniref:hypothetical protein n=1 Tax=Providencia rettgeri TaxID=587 RepID=UPI00384F6A6B